MRLPFAVAAKKFSLDISANLYYFINIFAAVPNGCAYPNSYEGDSCLRNVTGRGRHRLRAPPGRTGRREHSGAGILKRFSRRLTRSERSGWGAGRSGICQKKPAVGIPVGIRYVQRVEEDPVSARQYLCGTHDPGVLNAGGTAGILIHP